MGWAFQPSEPVSPLYLRDAGIVLAASVGLALFMVWLVDFLRPKSQKEPLAAMTGVAIYPPQGGSAIEQGNSIFGLASDPVPVLGGPDARDLSPAEIEVLFEGADLATRQLLGLLRFGCS
ncbi:MAG: hypothetical protein GY792_29130 [Gammaproteobacteria bacterium]|nr:hypothetical protein [Gammaproteobacteria bacterium]